MCYVVCGGTQEPTEQGKPCCRIKKGPASLFSSNFIDGQTRVRIVGAPNHVRCSIVVSISACHAEDPGSIPRCGAYSQWCAAHSHLDPAELSEG